MPRRRSAPEAFGIFPEPAATISVAGRPSERSEHAKYGGRRHPCDVIGNLLGPVDGSHRYAGRRESERAGRVLFCLDQARSGRVDSNPFVGYLACEHRREAADCTVQRSVAAQSCRAQCAARRPTRDGRRRTCAPPRRAWAIRRLEGRDLSPRTPRSPRASGLMAGFGRKPQSPLDGAAHREAAAERPRHQHV